MNATTHKSYHAEYIQVEEQPTPFNLSSSGVLFIFGIILSLSSSLYHNWPAIERILIDDRVFENLCSKLERDTAVPGLFICDAQRKNIGNLSLFLFFSEFVAFSICGPLTDVYGVYVVLMIGFMFGFLSFSIMYYMHYSVAMLRLGFCFWGFYGGSIIITSIHFARMFPDSTNLADGAMIFFENISCVMPLVIYKIMKYFNIKFYQAFGTYIIWAIVPSFILTAAFIPNSILSSKHKRNPQTLGQELQNARLWMNLFVYSIPVTAAIFYRKIFSSYFINNTRLIKVFPIVQLFVFAPTPFIAALDQFLGVHLTSSLLYLHYIVAYLCFLFPTETNGLISIILFVIAHSSEHQIMHYISEHHPNNESTLMGISYAVIFTSGSILERVFTIVYNKLSHKTIIYVIIILLIFSIMYSIYCHIQDHEGPENELTHTFRIFYVILWVIPFLFLCLVLAFNSMATGSQKDPETNENQNKNNDLASYLYQKISTMSVIFYSFSFYYVANCFLVVITIFKVANSVPRYGDRVSLTVLALLCYFVFSHIFVFLHFGFLTGYSRITIFVVFTIFFKMFLLMFPYIVVNRVLQYIFCFFLLMNGYVFFVLFYMLAYYNFKITYAERLYKVSLVHWASLLTMIMMFRFLYNEFDLFSTLHYIIWTFTTCFFLLFTCVLYFYFPYEMDIPFNFRAANLPLPSLSNLGFTKSKFSFGLFASGLLPVANLAVLFNIEISKKIRCSFVFILLTDIIFAISASYSKVNLGSSDADLYFSVFSAIFFIALGVYRLTIGDERFPTDRIVAILVVLNLGCLCLSSNLSWIKAQGDLQDESNCNCTCDCKENTKTCCDRCDCKISKNNYVCPSRNGNFSPGAQDGDNTKCVRCLLSKCSKRPQIDRPGGRIVFKFYYKHFDKVSSSFFSFLAGTLFGWVCFIVFMFSSRQRTHLYLQMD